MTLIQTARRTFAIQHGDSRENVADLSQVGESHPYAQESAIVWYEDVRNLRFVRVVNLDTCRHRDGSLVLPTPGRVIGYAQLEPTAKPNAETGRFLRRVFYVLAEDAPLQADGKLPSNAVDPRRIGPRLFMERMANAKQPANDAKSAQGDACGLNQVDIDTLLEGDLVSAGADTGIDAEANAASQQTPAQQNSASDFGYLDPVGGGDVVRLLKDRLSVGRSSRSDIVLAFKNVSARHCELSLDSGYWFIEDKGSTNGVKINDRKIEAETRRRLDPGSKVSIGKHHYTIQYSPAELGSDGVPPAEEVSREFMGVSLLNRIGLR